MAFFVLDKLMAIYQSSFDSNVNFTLLLTNCSISTAITYSPVSGAEGATVPSISVNAAMFGSGTGPAKNETLAWETGLPISSLTIPKNYTRNLSLFIYYGREEQFLDFYCLNYFHTMRNVNRD